MQNNKPIRVLVTGVGAIIGQGIVKSLRKCSLSITIIGLDLNMTPLALSLCDVGVAKPDVSEESDSYRDFWIALIIDQKIDFVIPGLEVDLFFLNQYKDFLPTKILLNNPDLIELAKDKWRMSQFLKDKPLAWIPSCIDLSWQDCLVELGSPPLLLKPRVGNGSRGVVRIDDEIDFNYWKQKIHSPLLIQKYIGNAEEEYTAAAFGLGDGKSLPAITFRRKLSVAGNTQYAEIVKNPEIDDAITLLSEMLEPLGPTNYQFRYHQGEMYLLEINPRISSSTSLRSAFGYNEACMALRYFLEGVIPQMNTIEQGTAWRYTEDFVV